MALVEDPFRRMLREMEETMERFRDAQDGLGGSLRGTALPVDVQEDGDEIVVRADLPGVEKDHIQVSATDDTLEIGAEDTREVREENEKYLRQERRQRRSHRTLQLPVQVDPGSAEAEYENGVLTVRLEKAGNSRRRDIDVS